MRERLPGGKASGAVNPLREPEPGKSRTRRNGAELEDRAKLDSSDKEPVAGRHARGEGWELP